jgi:anti-anti-sigma factor
MSDPRRIAINGEFTIFNALPIREQLLAALAETQDVEVDLSQVSEIDSTGLQLIIAAFKEATAKQKTIRFVNHGAAVADLLKLIDPASFLDAETPAQQGGNQP